MHAHRPDLLFAMTVAGALVITFCFFSSIMLAIRLRLLGRRSNAAAQRLESELAALRRALDAASARETDQARRIAWLESRTRPALSSDGSPERGHSSARVSGDASGDASKPELSITERRHRVLSLARRGLDVSTIAAMLGELQGEVELIIGLHRAA